MANPVFGENVTIGEGVTFGSGVVVHDGSIIGDGCVIEDNAVLGKIPRIARTSNARRIDIPGMSLRPYVTVGAGAVIFAGTHVSERAVLGDQTYVRERVQIGEDTVIGRGSAIENDVLIGERCKVQTMVYLTAFSIVEDDVFVGPCVVTANDNTMARHDTDYHLVGATLRRACRIGAAVVLTPGTEVGEEAFVAAGALVTRHVAPRAVVRGVPARQVGFVSNNELLHFWR